MKNKNRNNRHELKKAREARNAFIILAIAIAGIIIGVAYINRMPSDVSKPLPVLGIPATYSLREMQEVWTNNFQDLLDKELFGNSYPLPKIQERFNVQTRMIEERFHANLTIHLVTTYTPESTNALAGCWITNDLPQLDIVIPKLVDIYYDQRNQRDQEWRTRMQDEVIVSIMHERDHLAFGLVSGTREHPSSLDQLVDDEAKAWALTCEYTLRPMIEDYNMPLIRSDHIYYEKWIQGGRDENSLIWKNFIRSLYQVTRQ